MMVDPQIGGDKFSILHTFGYSFFLICVEKRFMYIYIFDLIVI